jgi:endogenous inhibitor of DNA gyrase (YacG/DUF329 family)
MSASKPPIVACPQCGKEHVWDTANRYRPFCCERCKMIDLGKWANEDYRVEVRERDAGDQEPQA